MLLLWSSPVTLAVCSLNESGKGYADFVYLPRPKYLSDYPALVVELKWDKSAESAIAQIKERRYTENVSEYTGSILLVGINYDKDAKTHECTIEKVEKSF
jgi:hypothetical protein